LTRGSLSDWWAILFAQLFGWGAIPATLLLAGFSLLVLLNRVFQTAPPGDEPPQEAAPFLPLDVLIGLELLFVVGLAAAHLLAADADHALSLARAGKGGGYVGWGVSRFLVDLVGAPVAGMALFAVGLAGVVMTFRLNPYTAAEWVARFNDWVHRRLDEVPPDIVEMEPEPEPEPAVETVPTAPQEPATALQNTMRPLDPPPLNAASLKPVMPKTRHRLPPLDLLSPPAQTSGQDANARYQAQIIEETLYGFGIPVEVVEINRGPTVTQFGLKLGTVERKLPDGSTVQQRVRVNKIVALANDLALALSAAPIRIEAPVPGRPLVGIEVPNGKKTMVSLREVLDSRAFKKTKGALRVALGKDVSGSPVAASLANMPHLLIAGATGSGKSVCVNSLIATLLFTHTPDQLQLLMVDPKMVELTSFNGIPHLIGPVVTDFEEVVGALAWATREMERRYKLFAQAGARHITAYNQKSSERLPYIVVIIDELADLMMLAPDEVERHICRLAQMSRATGIHLVIATQRPSVDVVTGLIKANFPTRIAFAVTSQTDSRVILDTPGAERLLGRGDMLYMAPDSAKLRRLQGCFVSDVEINNLVTYWKSATAVISEAEGDSTEEAAPAEPPWADIVAEADKDDLLEEAIKLVVESGRASTSMLQRRLGIGYPRASRLMDQLEEEGIVGPADGSRPREVLWHKEADEDDYDGFEHDVAVDFPPEE
ncbi:MAG: DNA translocase FtsK, partial [Chloroflexi bacterium]